MSVTNPEGRLTDAMRRGMNAAGFTSAECAAFLAAARKAPARWTEVDRHLAERYEAARGFPLPMVRCN